MINPRAFCKRCFLDESAKEFKTTLDAYLKSLDPSVKADDAEYTRRLAVCDGCENAADGLCRLCGCFILARCVKKDLRCPAPVPKW